MLSDKKTVLQLVALLKEHKINKIVLCGGSRNIPLIQTFSSIPYFSCYSMTDERSAGFFALGLALQIGSPVVVCCTSGSAVLNLYPAVAEAYYQEVPLIVLSADRPELWIGQRDGQTIRQENVFEPMVKMSVHLPEIKTKEDSLYNNRLINEAILASHHRSKGPVHINVPISTPLFNFSETALPKERKIERYEGISEYRADLSILKEKLNSFKRKLVLVGQMNCIYLFDKKSAKNLNKHFVFFAENLANRTTPKEPIQNFDKLLATFSDKQKENLRPDLVITYGGHIVSKQLKEYLRTYPPKEHWHISKEGEVMDLFGVLTTIVEADPFEFFEYIADYLSPITSTSDDFQQMWELYSKREYNLKLLDYSGLKVVGEFLQRIPLNSCLHLGNSSSVRYAQCFKVPAEVEIQGNRGTSGIEGSLSTALGYAFYSRKINFLILGDLSFFYDMNSLWSGHIRPNMRILLLNNAGGEIFYTIKGLEMTKESKAFITTPHTCTAESWAKEQGLEYKKVVDLESLEEALPILTSEQELEQPLLVEVFTDLEKDAQVYQEYMKNNK